jgi:hypothetical protein
MSAQRRAQRLHHRFVEFVPEQLEPRTLYISMDYGTVVHSCLCGCGQRVITPLTPTDWHLTYDGETISLSRSVGNWSFPCQSHYVIERSRVHWAGAWSKERIDANRAHDLEVKRGFYESDRGEPKRSIDTSGDDGDKSDEVTSSSWWARMRSRVSRH